MIPKTQNCIADLLIRYESAITEDWMREQLASDSFRGDLIVEAELRQQSSDFLALFAKAISSGNFSDLKLPEWGAVLEFLSSLSSRRARLGFSSSETAIFVFSLKQPIFVRIQQELSADADKLTTTLWTLSMVLDKLGLYTTEVYIKSREDVIKRQQIEMLELSTPVIKLWEGIVAVPLIGTLDSARTSVVMENLGSM